MGTFYGKYLLPIHNFAIGIGIIMSIILISKRKLIATDIIPVILGLLFYIIIVVFVYIPTKSSSTTFPRNKICDKLCQNPENRLLCPFPNSWYFFSFILSIIIMFIWIKPFRSKILCFIIFSINFIIFYKIYPQTVSSVWCFAAAIISPLIVILNYYLIKNINSEELVS
jgi:hypothetical protein